MDDLDRFVPNVHFEKIPIKNLVSNQDYQRNLSQAHIEKTAENFDIFQINPVKVSRRDGINYVFNGQHTIEIVALASGSRETPVWCMIYDDLCYAHEADIFANQMKFVKSLLPYEIFMANIEAKNPDQLMIRDLVESYGMKISAKRAPGHICAVSTLEAIYKKYGYQVLNRVLRLIIATWEGDSNSFSANIMNAVAKLCVVYFLFLLLRNFGMQQIITGGGDEFCHSHATGLDIRLDLGMKVGINLDSDAFLVFIYHCQAFLPYSFSLLFPRFLPPTVPAQRQTAEGHL